MIALKDAKKKLKRIRKNVRGLKQQRQAMKALLIELDMLPRIFFCKEFAQPAWFMDDHPFTAAIIKNHPLSLRISHYQVDHEKFEPYVQGMKDLEECAKELREKKIFYKEFTTYGNLEDVYRLMYVNRRFFMPSESESSIQVTE